jgi:hypothetical protein
MLTGFLFGFMVFTMYNAELTSYLTRYSPQGADLLPHLPLHVGTAGKNHLKEEINPLLFTGASDNMPNHIKFRTCSALSSM